MFSKISHLDSRSSAALSMMGDDPNKRSMKLKPLRPSKTAVRELTERALVERIRSSAVRPD